MSKTTVNSYKTETFAAEIVNNAETAHSNKLKIESPTYYQHRLNSFKAGDKVTINITNKRPKRTGQQNRYLWGVYYPEIAKETGEQDLDKLHELFKLKFLTTGIHKVLGNEVRMVRSTTDLTVSEFIEFIMSIEGLTGVAAPPPENYSLSPLKK